MNDEITLSEATAYFPKRNGKPVTLATLRYRIKVGCRGVKLDGWFTGGGQRQGDSSGIGESSGAVQGGKGLLEGNRDRCQRQN